MRDTWFEELFGFRETDADAVRKRIRLQGEDLISEVNGRRFRAGALETPRLDELRERLSRSELPEGEIRIREVVGDVAEIHADSDNAGALVQAASQFNLLEMVAPEVTPEQGITGYAFDRTQGPVCAMACAAGTLYRQYFAEVEGQRGQTSARQLDCLRDLGVALGDHSRQWWEMRNGYALATPHGLDAIRECLGDGKAPGIDRLRGALRVGIQWDTEVTLPGTGHSLTQVYCSGLPIAYGDSPTAAWRPFAELVLEASYEATLHVAALNWRRTGNPVVYLTLVGGGVFGNPEEWILRALSRAITIFARVPLDLRVVSYQRSKPSVRAWTETVRSELSVR